MVRGYRPPLPVMERLERKSIRQGECHLCAGATDRNGYGQMTTGSRIDGSRRLEYVHRVAWREANEREIPEELVVDHICHVRRCWRPTHLRLLTVAENSRTVTPELTVIRRANLAIARDVLRMQRNM